MYCSFFLYCETLTTNEHCTNTTMQNLHNVFLSIFVSSSSFARFLILPQFFARECITVQANNKNLSQNIKITHV